MKNDIKVKGDKPLVKRNGGVINTDKDAYHQAKRQKERQLEIDKAIKKSEELEERINGIEQSLHTIIELLKQGK